MCRLLIALIFLTMVAEDAAARVCPRNKNFPLVEKGITLDEITRLIGKPISAESGPEDSKVLFYCLASSFLDTDGSDTREHWVQMMKGKVIGYGERSDAAAMMRAQRQYAAAWASTNMIVSSANQAADRMVNADAPDASIQIKVQQNMVVPQSPQVAPPANQAEVDWRKWNDKNL